MGYYKTEGIVLRQRNFSETDKLIILYTKDYGKINCIAKGVKKIRSTLAGRVELFTHSYFLIAKGRNLDIITDGEIKNSNIILRENLELFLISSSIVELVDKTQEELEKNRKIFNLLTSTFSSLSNTSAPIFIFRVFQANFIKFLGYHPQLYRCVRCRKIPLNSVRFSFEKGGIICERCFSSSPSAIKLTKEELSLLRYIFKITPSSPPIKTKETLDKKLQNVLKYFLEYRYGNILKCDIYHIF